jgi:hypothetical protein
VCKGPKARQAEGNVGRQAPMEIKQFGKRVTGRRQVGVYCQSQGDGDDDDYDDDDVIEGRHPWLDIYRKFNF